MQRRLFLGTALGGIIAGLSASVWAGTTANGGGTHGTHGTRRKPTSAQADARARAIQTDLVAIEKGVDGRLGVAVFDLETDMRAGHRIDERFAMCSTS
ncbi:MAG: hypothetical protein QOH33_2528, partial [Paraburkholderia sp.]|nr:hypothetical protein [Paraburkholderia sp.]